MKKPGMIRIKSLGVIAGLLIWNFAAGLPLAFAWIQERIDFKNFMEKCSDGYPACQKCKGKFQCPDGKNCSCNKDPAGDPKKIETCIENHCEQEYHEQKEAAEDAMKWTYEMATEKINEECLNKDFSQIQCSVQDRAIDEYGHDPESSVMRGVGFLGIYELNLIDSRTSDNDLWVSRFDKLMSSVLKKAKDFSSCKKVCLAQCISGNFIGSQMTLFNAGKYSHILRLMEFPIAECSEFARFAKLIIKHLGMEAKLVPVNKEGKPLGFIPDFPFHVMADVRIPDEDTIPQGWYRIDPENNPFTQEACKFQALE
ncbi:hypothetical protein ACFL6Y_09925 [Elusimicrobiota bacterium]